MLIPGNSFTVVSYVFFLRVKQDCCSIVFMRKKQQHRVPTCAVPDVARNSMLKKMS